jgi:hypothetical protein
MAGSLVEGNDEAVRGGGVESTDFAPAAGSARGRGYRPAPVLLAEQQGVRAPPGRQLRARRLILHKDDLPRRIRRGQVAAGTRALGEAHEFGIRHGFTGIRCFRALLPVPEFALLRPDAPHQLGRVALVEALQVVEYGALYSGALLRLLRGSRGGDRREDGKGENDGDSHERSGRESGNVIREGSRMAASAGARTSESKRVIPLEFVAKPLSTRSPFGDADPSFRGPGRGWISHRSDSEENSSNDRRTRRTFPAQGC